MTQTEKLLRELIALPSVNPAFLPPQAPNAGEQRVADFLAATAAHAGLAVAFQPVLPGRSNLLAVLSPRHVVRHRVLLAPHLDTVDADPEQFTPRAHRGRLYGRGACDTKGSVASMLLAVCDLARAGARPAHTEIVFAGLVDEENQQAGSRALAASGLGAGLAIVGEGTRLAAVTAHKGSLWLCLQTRGRSAHGSRPELGRNAILSMAQIVVWLQTGYASFLRRRRHSLLGFPTVSVGTISGGIQPNIVPAACGITVDRRTLPGETEAGVERELRMLLRRQHLPASVSSTKSEPCLPMETNARDPLVAQFLRCLGQRKPIGAHYFCDASVLAHAGIPSVVFGPGDIAQAHTADEWIALDSLEKARARLASFLRALP